MSIAKKIENSAENIVGKVKEGVGKATNDHSLEASGRADQVKAKAKNAVEDIKDAARSAHKES